VEGYNCQQVTLLILISQECLKLILHARSTGSQPNENSNFFEVAVFLKKKFAFRPHLIGAARITTADFLSCLEAKELCFELQKSGRTGNRGELVVTLQFDVSHKDAESAIEAVRPGHYKKLALQLINRVVIHTLKELPKNAECVCPRLCLFF
jgi:hypothetical protein